MSTEIKHEEWFGKELIINQDVVYIGEGADPKDDPYFQAWLRAFDKIRSDRLQKDQEEK